MLGWYRTHGHVQCGVMVVHMYRYIYVEGDTRTHEASLDMSRITGLLTEVSCFPSATRSKVCSSNMLCSGQTQLIRWHCKNVTENVPTILPQHGIYTKPSMMYVVMVNISIKCAPQLHLMQFRCFDLLYIVEVSTVRLRDI